MSSSALRPAIMTRREVARRMLDAASEYFSFAGRALERGDAETALHFLSLASGRIARARRLEMDA